MRKTLQRGMCAVLCVIMAFSCTTVPAGAVVISPVIAEAAKVVGSAVVNWFVGKAVDESLQGLSDWISGKSVDTDGLIAHIGALKTAQKTLVTEERLRELAYEWNTTCSDAVGFTVDVVDHTLDTGEVYRVIAVRRGYVVTTAAVQYCLADGVSRILYCDATTELSGRWAPEGQTSGRHLLDYNALFNLSQEVGGLLRLKDNFYEIYKRDGTVYCNVAGRRFSCIYESDKAAVNQDRPTTGGTIIEGDTITNIENTYNEDNDTIVNNDYSQDIDIENMQQALPGGTINNIDNLIYDENTKTYYVDSHDVTNNITQNYSYQYHINYTSITYIGQTEEYNKRYELYYQLPDGRDSADLTPEELEQLNVDIDVIPYVRYADNMDVRSLYHFDADTLDSSYWNYTTSFEWITGASLTYMESGAFNGALYLDENEHDFKLHLPTTADATGDWTLQWRYYQSHTEAPVNDSTVYVGDLPVLTMDGSALYTPAGDQITVIPTGSWNELCIIRSDCVLHYYVNGVCYASVEDMSVHYNSVRFRFGDQQQTYKYFDELRFTRGAVYDAGENYTPTSVPHDSNLTLVLPTGTDYVVDQVPVYTGSPNNLLTQYGYADWSGFGSKNLWYYTNPFYDIFSYWDHLDGSVLLKYPIVRDSQDVSLVKDASGSCYVNFGGTTFVRSSPQNSNYKQPKNSFTLPLFFNYWDMYDDFGLSFSSLVGDWESDTTYTFSVVLADGSYSFITFRVVLPSRYAGYSCEVIRVVHNSEIQFSVENLGLVQEDSFVIDDSVWTAKIPITAICWNSADGDAYVRYTELVKGDTPEFQIDYETAVYTSGELEHTPTLAVRTDVNITDYQIGGVRPSVPEKGQVWALVEKGYITSLQVYNGSVWLNADGRIWTGSRWIPASSYNVITLQDMYDIVDATEDYEYIYTESGFWDWLQRAWKDLLDRLDQLIAGGGSGLSDSDCQHVYDSAVEKDATCTDPGRMTYTCSNCGHVYTELIDALGHDWVVTDHFDAAPTPVLEIIKQPRNAYAAMGEYFIVSFEAVGEGLTYQWYFQNAGSTSWSKATGFPSGRYSLQMTSSRNGRKLYCRVTDAYGNQVTTNIVTVSTGEAPVPDLEIIMQPRDVYALDGKQFDVTLEAVGEGLSYQWYYRAAAESSFSILSDVQSNVYTASMCSALRGGQLYCIVTDADGNSLQSNTVTLTMVADKAHDALTCSRCDLTTKDFGDGPLELETDIFEAAGDLLAEGITWTLDKLMQLIDALTTITETFNRFVERVGALAGAFPLFFAAFFALIPEDLATVLWFGVICFVVLAVWRKWSK